MFIIIPMVQVCRRININIMKLEVEKVKRIYGLPVFVFGISYLRYVMPVTLEGRAELSIGFFNRIIKIITPYKLKKEDMRKFRIIDWYESHCQNTSPIILETDSNSNPTPNTRQ